MKKEDLFNGLWFWRTNDGYFKKINNPCLVIEKSEDSLKIKMFDKLGSTEELFFKNEEEIALLIKQSRMCEKEEIQLFFKQNLDKFEKTIKEVQLKIDNLTNNLLLVD